MECWKKEWRAWRLALAGQDRPGELLGCAHHDPVAGGRIADIVGRKRMFIIGGVAFSAAALLGLTVSSMESLIAVRAFMGFSAGLILAATGGVLVTTMHGTTRHDAWLLWRGAGMAGMVLGPTVGPVIASAPNWRRLFLAEMNFSASTDTVLALCQCGSSWAVSLVLDQRAIYEAAGSLLEPAHRETDRLSVYFSAH